MTTPATSTQLTLKYFVIILYWHLYISSYFLEQIHESITFLSPLIHHRLPASVLPLFFITDLAPIIILVIK